MRRLAVFFATALLSTSLWAMHCPADMAKIDDLLKTRDWLFRTTFAL